MRPRRKKEGRRREDGRRRAEDERVWFRPHFLSPSLLPPSLPDRPTDRPTTIIIILQRNAEGEPKILVSMRRGNILPKSKDTFLYRVMFFTIDDTESKTSIHCTTALSSKHTRVHLLFIYCEPTWDLGITCGGNSPLLISLSLSPLPVQCHRISGAPSVKIIVLP